MTKPNKLTSKQRLVLVAAVNNNGGVDERAAGYSEIQTLRFLGMIAHGAAFTEAELARKSRQAWIAASVGIRERNLKALEDSLHVLRNEKYDKEKRVYSITPKGRKAIQNDGTPE